MPVETQDKQARVIDEALEFLRLAGFQAEGVANLPPPDIEEEAEMGDSKTRQMELEIEALRGLLTLAQQDQASSLAEARWVTEVIHGRPWHVVEKEERERSACEARRKIVDEYLPVAVGLSDFLNHSKRREAWERLLRVSEDYRSGYLDFCREINVKPRM